MLPGCLCAQLPEQRLQLGDVQDAKIRRAAVTSGSSLEVPHQGEELDQRRRRFWRMLEGFPEEPVQGPVQHKRCKEPNEIGQETGLSESIVQFIA